MDALFLIKIGEIRLKDGNRAEFENRLKRDIKRRLSSFHSELTSREGRYYLKVDEENAAQAEFALSRTPGVNGWARAVKTPKTMDRIAGAALDAMAPLAARGISTFKVESRRSDKGFPLDSYGISREVGGAILERFPAMRVDVHNPHATVYVEVREKAYVYTDGTSGVRGLPVGSGGRGLLLLSGGIDSPVAGYMMLGRGLALESLYFHAYPYTSREAWEKVRDLAANLATYSGGMLLHTAHFTEVQLKIKKDALPEKTTLYLRACMMLAADMLAKRRGLNSIVSGESLGQVASQTAENMRFTGAYTDLAILRPLAGTDKEDTIRTARTIGTYDISILPYEDCCVLFSPKHPVLKAKFEEERAAFDALGFRDVVAEAVAGVETVELPFTFTPPRAAEVPR
ncbi:MAG: tRNA 4-thiouridine(8) synthase ThiI [Spirochaetae bacterium HGW-Spirochaetae-3]|jgi:thiamine biosynthesis protein ThiI|nr:MAG: tRNA 4-thiouridine(8) synthase ThiI [Spirochaetae bacterium HGW-Spirochaetae-3]